MSAHQQQWFFSSGDERYGPVGFEYLIELAKSGQLDPRNDMVWTTTLNDWEPAGEIEGLFERRAARNDEPSMDGGFASTGTFESKPIPKASFPGTGRIGMVMGVVVVPPLLMAGWAYALPLILPHVPEGYREYLPRVIIPLVGLLVLATLVKRFRNIGMSGWWVLGLCIPVVNLWLGYRLLASPAGYAVARKLDIGGKLMAVLYWGCLIAGIGLVAAAGMGLSGESQDAGKWQDIMTQISQLWRSSLPER